MNNRRNFIKNLGALGLLLGTTKLDLSAQTKSTKSGEIKQNVEKEDLNKVGVILGVGIGGIHTFEEEVAGYEKTKDDLGPKFNPFFIPKMRTHSSTLPASRRS